MASNELSREEFAEVWAKLCRRFGRTNDPEEAAEYYGFLVERMGASEFRAAAAACWATREFFPRPADFLLVRSAHDWRTVLTAVQDFHPPHHTGGSAWQRASTRIQEATRQMGGLPALKEAVDRDPIRARKEWMRCYEQVVVGEAATTLALRPSKAPRVPERT